MTVEGAILVWGAVTQEGRAAVMEETGLHDVIGLDRIIAECAEWKPEAYCRLVSDSAGGARNCSRSSMAKNASSHASWFASPWRHGGDTD